MTDLKNTSESANDSSRQRPTDPELLATVFLRTKPFEIASGWRLVYWRDDFWRWTGRHYQRYPEHELRAELTRCLQQHFRSARSVRKSDKKRGTFSPEVTRPLVANVLQALQALTLITDAFEPPAWLPDGASAPGGSYLVMKNGLLDLNGVLEGAADVLIPHNTRWFSLVALDYPYEGTRSCPGWIAFLKVVLEGDEARIALLQEWFGYLLTHDTSQQKFLVVVGEGANGKSVVLTVLTALLGHENVSHVPLEMFGDKFQLSRTLGKLANIAPEVGELDRVAEGQLKALASGDRQHFDRKFQDAIEAQPTARFVFSTNSLPRFADRSEGIWRRLSIIPFQVSVPPERQDPRLADSLTAELPGIFSWAVEGLRRLRSNGRFTEPAVSVRVREEHRTESNFARAFLTEETVFRPGAQTPCATLYAAYKFRCEVEGRRALDAGQFGKEVPRTHPKVIKRRPAGGPASRQYVYLNLAMRSDPVPVVPPSGPRLLRRVV